MAKCITHVAERVLTEAAAKDLRNAPRGRVASLMESWEEDQIFVVAKLRIPRILQENHGKNHGKMVV